MPTGINSLNQDHALKVGTLIIGETEVTEAGAQEIRRSSMAGRLVPAGSEITLTIADHEGRIICFDTASGSIATLPDAIGSGAIFKFLITVTATSNSHIIKVANALDEMRGFIVADASEPTSANIWWAADNDDTITFNRTNTGTAAQGHYVEALDVTDNHWYIRGFIEQSDSEATPFSSSV